MQVGIRYGKGEIKVNVPDENLVDVLQMKDAPPITNPLKEIEKKLEDPIESKPLSELAEGEDSACIVISDITRPVPNKLILPPILDILEKQGIEREKIVILIATGIHRPNQGDELIELVGKEIVDKYKIVNHFSRRIETHSFLGKTSKGTPVYLNKTYLEADLKILTGLIEPHLMAGYSGGRKSICPGISSIETMKVMHGPVILEAREAHPGILEGNPFHQEATEIAQMAGVDFIANVVINDKRQVIGFFAGDLVEAHLAGRRLVEKHFKISIREPVDIVLISSAGYPLDATYYQAIKGAVAAIDIVKQNGTIILAAECSEGIGSPEFTELVLGTRDLDEFVEGLYKPESFVIDQWQLEEMAKVERKAQVYFYSTGIPEEQLKQMSVKPLENIDEGIRLAMEKHGKKAKIVVVPEGPYVLPVVESPIY